MAFEQRLMEMWRSLPILDGERLPRRSKVKTAFISSMLPNCWQLDWREGDKLIIEYEGNEVDAMWGDTPKGQDYLANYSPEHRDRLLAFYHSLFDARCGATLVRSISKKGGNTYELVTNFVPMSSKNGERRIIFGNSEMQGNFKDDTGRLDFGSATLISATYIDLGYGIPDTVPFQEK